MIKRGFRYLPDPMGRVGEGDWLDANGRRVEADEAARIARAPSQSISRGPRNFITAPDAASHRVAVREKAQPRTLPTWRSPTALTDHDIAPINGALREAVVANALQFRKTAPNELARIANTLQDRALGRRGYRSQIYDMLLQAADNAASPDERLHARGLLSVYRMEMEEAGRRSEAEPTAVADRALTHFIADQSGQVAWSVYRIEDEDNLEVSEASDDDPDKSSSKKPRGMANPKSSEAAKDGYRRHEQQWRPYVQKKGPGWRYGEGVVDPKTGTYVYPDVTTPRNRTMDMKPDTPTGRAAGAKQIERYERATGERSKVFTYREFTTPPRPPNVADEKGGLKWMPSPPRTESGQAAASGRAPAAARPTSPPRVFGSGGNILYPKLNKPFYLNRLWEMPE